MNILSRLHIMIDDIFSEDPRTAIIAFRELNDHHMPWLEKRVVALARREHWGWARIARLLGRSRQDIHKRFRAMVPSLPHDPLAEYHRWELETARLAKTGGMSPGDEAIPW